MLLASGNGGKYGKYESICSAEPSTCNYRVIISQQRVGGGLQMPLGDSPDLWKLRHRVFEWKTVEHCGFGPASIPGSATLDGDVLSPQAVNLYLNLTV